MSSGKKLLGRYEDIPPQFFFWACVILIVIPYLSPLGTPVLITKYTQSFVNTLQDVPEGGYVVISLDSAMGGIIETGGALQVTLKYFVDNRPDVHLVIWGLHYDAPLVYSQYVLPLVEKLDYGTQYINFGYIPGQDTAVAKLSDDIPGMLRFDANGDPIGQFSIMDNINDADDIDLVCYYTTGLVAGYIGHWFERYGTKLLETGLAGGLASAAMTFDAGQILGYAAGVRGSAELEALMGYPSFATATIDALNVMNVFIIAILFLTNIVFYWKRMGGST